MFQMQFKQKKSLSQNNTMRKNKDKSTYSKTLKKSHIISSTTPKFSTHIPRNEPISPSIKPSDTHNFHATARHSHMSTPRHGLNISLSLHSLASDLSVSREKSVPIHGSPPMGMGMVDAHYRGSKSRSKHTSSAISSNSNLATSPFNFKFNTFNLAKYNIESSRSVSALSFRSVENEAISISRPGSLEEIPQAIGENCMKDHLFRMRIMGWTQSTSKYYVNRWRNSKLKE